MAIETRKRKGGHVVYLPRVRDPDGKWFETNAFENLADAKAEEARLLRARQGGFKNNTSESKRVTLEEYWEVWSEENRTETSAGWKISQDQMFRDHVRPILGGFKLAEIDAPKIGKLMKAAASKGLSAQTRLHVYRLVNQMLGDAVSYYTMLAQNPVRPEFHMPKVKEKEASFLRPVQAVKLLDAARAHPFMGPPVWLQMLAGMRSEAALAVPWSAVQWDQDQILICQAWKQKERRLAVFPKGGKQEYVPMTEDLKGYLQELWDKSGKLPADFVCKSIGGKMLSYNTYSKALPRLCRQAEVPIVSSHELRHSCTELFTAQGAGEEDLRRLLNHKHAATTRRYMHRTDERLSAIAKKVKLRLISAGDEASKLSTDLSTRRGQKGGTLPA